MQVSNSAQRPQGPSQPGAERRNTGSSMHTNASRMVRPLCMGFAALRPNQRDARCFFLSFRLTLGISPNVEAGMPKRVKDRRQAPIVEELESRPDGRKGADRRLHERVLVDIEV